MSIRVSIKGFVSGFVSFLRTTLVGYLAPNLFLQEKKRKENCCDTLYALVR